MRQPLVLILLLLTAGCLPGQSASMDAMSKIQVGDTIPTVESKAAVWQNWIFIRTSAAGEQDSAFALWFAGGGKQAALPLVFIFHNQKLTKVVRQPPVYHGYAVPSGTSHITRNYQSQLALIKRLETATPLSPEEQAALVRRQPDVVDSPLARYVGVISFIPECTFLLPFEIANADALRRRHEEWDPRRLKLGSTLEEANQIFGRPIELTVEPGGMELALYCGKDLRPPILVTFERGRSVQIACGALATADDKSE